MLGLKLNHVSKRGHWWSKKSGHKLPCQLSRNIPVSSPEELTHRIQGPVSISKTSFPGMGIPMLKIRRSYDRLIFNMGIPILIRRHLNIEMSPWSSLVEVVVCYLCHAKPSPEPKLTYHQTLLATHFNVILFTITKISLKKKMQLKLATAKCETFLVRPQIKCVKLW